jgi:peptidoglycan hydrolase-like protein with peptidoglycan-binding domain
MSHPTIQKGSQGPEVKLAQSCLNQRRIVNPPLAVDGDFGPKTFAAVDAYQKARQTGLTPDFNLNPDDIVGLRTWSRLDPELIKLHSQGPSVKLAQELLNKNGASVTIDSDFGPMTKAAVEAFQGNPAHKDFEGHPLQVDGVVGIRTWAALNS